MNPQPFKLSPIAFIGRLRPAHRPVKRLAPVLLVAWSGASGAQALLELQGLLGK